MVASTGRNVPAISALLKFYREVPKTTIRLALLIGSVLSLGGFLLPNPALLAIGSVQCAIGLLLYSKTTKKFLVALSSLVVGVVVGAAFALRLGLPLSNADLTYQKAFAEFAAGSFLTWTFVVSFVAAVASVLGVKKAGVEVAAAAVVDAIAFASNRSGSWQIYLMDTDGSNVTQLTDCAGENAFPVVSPDGRTVAFESNRDGSWQLYAMDINGSSITRLTKTPGTSGEAGFSPDGKKIVFVSERGGSSQVYAMDPTGSHVTRLTAPPAESGGPVFNPDGTRIYFTSVREGRRQIYSMNADGSCVTRVTNTIGDNAHLRFSPDGRRVVFDSTREFEAVQIYSADVDGSNTSRLTHPPGQSRAAVFSPDGRKIAFESNRGGSWQLYVMDVDGSNVARLTGPPGLNRDSSFIMGPALRRRAIYQ